MSTAYLSQLFVGAVRINDKSLFLPWYEKMPLFFTVVYFWVSRVVVVQRLKETLCINAFRPVALRGSAH